MLHSMSFDDLIIAVPLRRGPTISWLPGRAQRDEIVGTMLEPQTSRPTYAIWQAPYAPPAPPGPPMPPMMYQAKPLQSRNSVSHKFNFVNLSWNDMGVSENRGTPKSSILIEISIINHPFWGYPYFRKHPYETFDVSIIRIIQGIYCTRWHLNTHFDSTSGISIAFGTTFNWWTVVGMAFGWPWCRQQPRPSEKNPEVYPIAVPCRISI